MTKDSKICVGQFAGAHGVRGLVRLRSFTEDPESIFTYAPLTGEQGRVFNVIRKSAAQSRLREAQSSRAQNKNDQYVVAVEGIANKEEADALRGDRLYIAREILPPTREGEYYDAELIGLRVTGKDGKDYGKILDMHDHGAGAFIEIGTSRKDSFMLPFKDAFVPEIDIKAGRVMIDVPEGWL